jgi:hypothetical protein
MFGIMSISSFALFWVFFIGSVMSTASAAISNDINGTMNGLFGVVMSFLFPIAGLGLGIAGVASKRSLPIPSWIGLILNGGLMLWVLLSAASGQR